MGLFVAFMIMASFSISIKAIVYFFLLINLAVNSVAGCYDSDCRLDFDIASCDEYGNTADDICCDQSTGVLNVPCDPSIILTDENSGNLLSVTTSVVLLTSAIIAFFF